MPLRILMVAGAVGAVLAMTPAPAQAGGGHGHTSFALGINLGVPCCYRPAYYGPAYYAPPPYYYYPPPVYYAPPPAYYPPAPAYGPTVSNCRDYHGDATIDGQGTPFYGRACLGGDGRWHIVNGH